MEISIKLNSKVFKPLTDEQLDSLSLKEVVVIAKTEQAVRQALFEQITELEEKCVHIQDNYLRLKNRVFSPKSEKSPREPNSKKEIDAEEKKPKDPSPKSLTERYPRAPVEENIIAAKEIPQCPCCGEAMQDSGMMETSEYLDVIPRQYRIIQQKRLKYRCKSCHSSIVTTPAPDRIIPGSSYSDELIIDSTLTKYCDLVPMERYCRMAERSGLPGLPPQSLIGCSFKLAKQLEPNYLATRGETLGDKLLQADETPHKMLEGDPKKNWFLWGFISKNACFYECHDTRSGDVASSVLKDSSCEALVTDVYSGYKKALRETNELRASESKLPIATVYCNSHARRHFKEEVKALEQASFMSEQYRAIYRLNKASKGKTDEEILNLRRQMRPYFERMKKYAEQQLSLFSTKSSIARAFNYFTKNYQGLIYCLDHSHIPLDNNGSERALRSYVVGRKTWYGTHSRRGAHATAVHFTLVESCKLNGANPRAYYKDAIQRSLAKQPVLTPRAFAEQCRAPPFNELAPNL
ncbi:MAG: IS66 family transposase [Proteobacteria bacterium]|nr:IS66 family transposase [Pseudomonadota bacterium]